MLKRILPLLAVLAFAVPAAAVADDGKTGGDKTPGAHLATVGQRLDARFHKFAEKCLVDKAPERCAHAASRLVHRFEKLQARIDKVESRIKEKCGQASPPKRCAHAADVTAQLDALKAKLAGWVGQIKAKYPSAA
jgi:hypothetical protein